MQSLPSIGNAVAVGVERREHLVGVRRVGSADAERVLEFALADAAAAVGVELIEQILQRGVAAVRSRGGRACAAGLAAGADVPGAGLAAGEGAGLAAGVGRAAGAGAAGLAAGAGLATDTVLCPAACLC